VSETITLKIDGMHCDACVRRVRTALSKVPGVEVQDVTVGSARVSTDPATVRPADVVKAVEEIGYEARPNQ
jgi:copper chaperone CopZ